MASEIYYIILALFMAVASGLVGAFALMRRMTLAADAMSHMALPGLGLALLYSFNPILGGAVTLIIGAIVIWKLESLSSINTEAIIGVIFTVSLAIGSLITPQEDIMEALFGGIKNLEFTEFALGILAALLVMTFIIYKKHALVLSLVSNDLAKTSGVNVKYLNLYFLVIFVLTIILGLRYLGALLMGSLIIIPAATARNLARDLNSMMFFSSAAAVISAMLGLFVVFTYHLQLGPVTIGIAGLIFILTLLFRKK